MTTETAPKKNPSLLILIHNGAVYGPFWSDAQATRWAKQKGFSDIRIQPLVKP